MPVRNAIARFNQVEGVSDAERDQASPGSHAQPMAGPARACAW